MTVQSKTMSVQIREGRLRTTPSFLGKIIGSVRYGDRVAVLEEKSSWLLVSPPDADRGVDPPIRLDRKKNRPSTR